MEFVLTSNKRISYIKHDNIFVNQLFQNDKDSHSIDVYLRLLEEDKIISLMSNSSKLLKTKNSLTYSGKIDGISFNVQFIYEGDRFDYNVEICGYNKKYDCLITLDLGLGEKPYLKTNEAYASHYLDHNILSVSPIQVMSRKTVLQDGRYPGIITSELNDVVAINTDGYQTFKPTFRDADNLENLKNDLENCVYQHEFSMYTFQTKVYNEDAVISIPFKLLDNVDESFNISEILIGELNVSDDDSSEYDVDLNSVKTISGEDMTIDEVDEIYPKKQLVEDNLSFFVGDNHVVLKQKEMLMERNHGHIMISSDATNSNEEVLANTVYMNGYFGGQISVGNTTFHQLLTPNRNSLNFNKTTGMRMYVDLNGEMLQLTLPSIFEMGINFAKWIYKIDGELLTILTYMSHDTRQINYEVDGPYNVYVSLDIDELGGYEQEAIEDYITFKPTNEYVLSKCSNLNYKVKGLKQINDLYQVIDNKFAISGAKFHEAKIIVDDFSVAFNKFDETYSKFMNGFKLVTDVNTISKFNVLTKWYLHNALIHYSTPKGLEQYVGAAWGTRDVLQGPMELFLTFQKYDMARDVLTRVYDSQFDDGNWSQWFMFDEYIEQAASESHGDVVVWPFKALANYIELSGDISILNEEVRFKLRTTPFTKTNDKFTILEHVKVQWQYLQNNLLEGTALPAYGDGDWDDTLQPKSEEQRKTMVSGWTAALLYEALTNLVKHIEVVDQEFASEINVYINNLHSDYHKYLINDDICAGFISKTDDEIKYLLHPKDETTSIKYRLLPINRGIISGIMTDEQIKKGLEIIDNKLKCVDGVRLMDKPANYNHGFNSLFQRAEQASTVGREVGLQYVHAHIRYIEAMAKLKRSDIVVDALNQIQPFDINEYVENSMLKQRNTYFSSSEGDFKTRYEFADNLEKLKTGDVSVKTGWRVYSSGPGIYINQLISNVLGVKVINNKLYLEPVLDDSFNNTSLNYSFSNKVVSIKFIKSSESCILINDSNTQNGIDIDSITSGDIIVVNF